MEVTRNFLESLAWVISAATHAIEARDEFLNDIAAELREIYQVQAEDLRKQGIELEETSWCVLKHLLCSLSNDWEDFAKRKSEGKPCDKLQEAMAKKVALIKKILKHGGKRSRARKCGRSSSTS